MAQRHRDRVVSDRRDKPGIYAVAAAGEARPRRSSGLPDGALRHRRSGRPARSRSTRSTAAAAVCWSEHVTSPIPTRMCFPSAHSGCRAAMCCTPPTARSNGARPPAAPRGSIEFSADVSFTRPAFTPNVIASIWTGRSRSRDHASGAVARRRQVAFAALGDLWLMPVDGTPRRLTHDPALDIAPAWSPDGTRSPTRPIAAASMNIWIRDLQSGADRQLTRLAARRACRPGRPTAHASPSSSDGQIQVVDVDSGAVGKSTTI